MKRIFYFPIHQDQTNLFTLGFMPKRDFVFPIHQEAAYLMVIQSQPSPSVTGGGMERISVLKLAGVQQLVSPRHSSKVPM
jgi:hypothetical protein